MDGQLAGQVAGDGGGNMHVNGSAHLCGRFDNDTSSHFSGSLAFLGAPARVRGIVPWSIPALPAVIMWPRGTLHLLQLHFVRKRGASTD